MKLLLLLLLLLLFFKLYSGEDGFCEVFNETVTNYTGEFSCNRKGCPLKITPKENFSIILTDVENYPRIWEMFNLNGTEYRILRQNFSPAYKGSVNYESLPGSGFIFEGNTERCDQKFQITRFVPESKKLTCGPMIRTIGKDITTINVKDCLYLLIPENLNDTLVIYSNDLSADVLTQDSIITEHYKQFSPTPHVVQIRKHSAAHSLKFSSVLIGETCNCPQDTSFLSNSLSIRSPGFPNFFCPNLHCKTRITVLPVDSEKLDLIPRLLLFIKGVVHQNAKLEIFNLYSFNAESSFNLSTRFLMKPVDFTLGYQTGKVLLRSPQLMGHFELNVSRIWIRKECDCSTFFDRKYWIDKTIKLLIPSHCNFMMCMWSFGADNSGKLKLQMSNGLPTDEIHVWTERFGVTYSKNKLESQKILNFGEAKKWVHVSFYRNLTGYAVNSTLNLDWKIVEDTDCLPETINLTTEKVAITSPNYPFSYPSDKKCSYNLEAPENHYITVNFDDFEVENFHDHLSVFDGNSSNSNLIAMFTGKFKDQVVTSTGFSLFLLFESDVHTSSKGFHLTVFAGPKSLMWPVHFLLLLIITVSISLGILFVVKKKRTIRNSLVRFTNDGSEISLSMFSN